MKVTLDLPCQKALFELDDEVTYLNCAYMSPQLMKVTQRGHEAMSRKSKPYQISVEEFFEPVDQLKQNFSRLINCNDPDRIAIIPAASYGMANVANNLSLQKGDQIIVVDEQFPSNYYCWKKEADKAGAEVIIISQNDSQGLSWNDKILENINEKTKVIALGVVHWADGTLFDLQAIRQRTTEVGALLVLDGTQSVGALPFDVQAIKPDALICASYKFLMGPYSIGLAYYGPYFDNGEPIEDNWINRLNSQDFKNLVNYQATYKSKANRYSVGEHSNFLLIPMLNAAVEQLLEWGPENIQHYCANLWDSITDGLLETGCYIEPRGNRCEHLVGVKLPANFDREKLNRILKEEKVFVSLRGAAIRVAPNVYNTEEDMQKLLNCFRKAIK